MGVGIRRSQRDYTLAFKLAVVDEVEQGALTYREAQYKYGIQGRSTVLDWLRRQLHPYGRKYEPQAMVQKITGSRIDSAAYLRYLTQKFGDIYGL